MKKLIWGLSLLLLCSCSSSKTDWQGLLSDKDDEIEELETRIAELEEQVENLEQEKEELQEQLDDAEDIIGRAKSACFLWEDDAFMVLSILNQY